MLNNLPKIDRRSREDVTRELKELILEYCPEWRNMDELESDKEVDALVRIFSNMAGNVIEQLNQAPEKNFIAFLNMIGISPTPPRTAKAPMVFKLKGDWEGSGFVPAGTRVSAQPENQEEVVFETESDLTLIQPKLAAAVSIDPNEDSWHYQDYVVNYSSPGKTAEIFRGRHPITHRVYIGHSKLFNFKEAASMQLKVRMTNSQQVNALTSWYYFDEEGNSKPLPVTGVVLKDGSNNSPCLFFSGVEGIARKTISGYDQTQQYQTWSNNWIYGELETPLTDESKMHIFEEIMLQVDISSGPPQPVDAALYNGLALDLTKDYYPFGSRPAFNDTFYIAFPPAFSKENAQVTLNVTLSDAQVCPVPDTQNIKLCWETWDGVKWRLLSETTKAGASTTVMEDTTKAFTTSGKIKFNCPGVTPCNVGGIESNWIRVRITGGGYGKDAYYDYTTKQYVGSTLKPPSIKELSVEYSYSIEEYPEAVITENNFVWADKTYECVTQGKYFKAFYACSDKDPAFYLAFDGDASSMPVSLFFPLSGDQLGGDQNGKMPVVAWEYWNGKRWLALSVNDAIKHFTRREILQFVAPADLTKCPLFGMDYYWIRARLEEGGYRVFPNLTAIYSNVIWARNANTVRDEILGSSNGEPSQSFQFSRMPVLDGQEVLVKETQGKEEWVKWEEVNTFSVSETGSRHYILDRSSGTLTFGDGMNGMIPPAGVGNIKCNYRYGGGTRGNVKAGSITNIWDSYPCIDSAVNPVPADGGFDQEEPEQAEIRGPHTLKSLDRGVTCEDIEWLVREAMSQVAKVKCLPTMDRELRFVPGKATVIVLPGSEEAKPVPSQEVLNEIEAYLSERTSAVIAAGDTPRIDVIGPDYIRVGVEAAVAYTAPGSSKVIEGRIIDSLKQFFHPLHGGQEKTGWEFGKNLYVSEVYSVIKDVPGVDYITNLSIKASVQCFTLNLELVKGALFKPSVTYPKYSAVKSSDNKIVFALAQTLPANTGVKTLMVKGFREGDRIKLRYRNYPPEELLVVSVAGDVLECRTADEMPLQYEYPVGSDLENDLYLAGSGVEAGDMPDLTIRSYILNEVNKNPVSFFVKIAVPETRDIVFLGRNDEYASTTPLKIREVRTGDIFLEEDELVYSGIHLINKKPELVFPYLLDNEADIVHDLSNITEQCRLEQISKEDRMYLKEIKEAPTAELCEHCFPRQTT